MPLYPIVPCRDGHVRLCVLNPRQWEAMSAWLGPDHPFTDPQYANIAKRMAVAGKVNALIGDLFLAHSAADLVAEGQRRGVPIAAVATPAQALADPHFAARGAFVPLKIADGKTGLVPSGYLEIDGQRAGIRDAAPALNAHGAAIRHNPPPRRPAPPAPARSRQRRPLDGVRVLDLGVIVAGAEAGRILADQGAEVIKVENRAFPDGGRQSMTGEPMTPSIAQGHRNKLSVGINLRSDRGRALFKRLVAVSDVILSNFKPGTLESLGLGYETLKAVNPRIVMMDSSALGNSGPQSRSLGYGPLVRAATGLSWLWRYPDVPDSFSDGVTIYPDHIAARVAAVGVMALLIRRERTGIGGTVSLSQARSFSTPTPSITCASRWNRGASCHAGIKRNSPAPTGFILVPATTNGASCRCVTTPIGSGCSPPSTAPTCWTTRCWRRRPDDSPAAPRWTPSSRPGPPNTHRAWRWRRFRPRVFPPVSCCA